MSAFCVRSSGSPSRNGQPAGGTGGGTGGPGSGAAGQGGQQGTGQDGQQGPESGPQANPGQSGGALRFGSDRKLANGFGPYALVWSRDLYHIASAMLAAGGASLILGLKPKIGILPLIGFLAIVSPMIHDFWNEQDAQSKQQQSTHFAKNMALAGAVLALMGVEEWPLSVAGS